MTSKVGMNHLSPNRNIHLLVFGFVFCQFFPCSETRSQDISGKIKDKDGNVYAIKTMPDGNQWMLVNLNSHMQGSHCYDNADLNCRESGRLYTWQMAMEGCKFLGAGWHLPSNEEWSQLARTYGGVFDDSKDSGRAAYQALIKGGKAGFNIMYGGRGDSAGTEYSHGGAHGFYWTATESDSAHAWFYNFAKNGRLLNHHRDGEKQMAISVRCIRQE